MSGSRRVPAFRDGMRNRMIVPIVWDVLSAAAAKAAGATHLGFSGAALNNVHGYPDRGLMDINDLARTVNEITNATGLPLIVDAETGFGGGPRLTYLVEELLRAGCTAVMIEDQHEAGATKTVGKVPELCDPEEMCDRIRAVRSVAGEEMAILARTDFIPGAMDIGDSLNRLSAYDAAGADWLHLVFAPDKAALLEMSRRFPNRMFTTAASRPATADMMRYIPTPEDLDEINPLVIGVSGQYRNAYVALKRAYGLSLGRQWDELFAERTPAALFDEELGLTRPGFTG